MSIIATALAYLTDSKNDVLGKVSNLIDETFTSKEERDQAHNELAKIKSDSQKADQEAALKLREQEIEAMKIQLEADGKQDVLKADIIKTELKSDDAFVRRARPMVVYVGLLVALLEVLGVRLMLIKLVYGSSPEFATAIGSSDKAIDLLLTSFEVLIGGYIFARSAFDKGAVSFNKKTK